MSGDRLIEEARQHEKKLVNFFWRLGVSISECEDLVQETYLRLWRCRDGYRPTAKFTTFLFLIARQVRIDALRRQTRREGRETDYAAMQSTIQPPPNGDGEEVRRAVLRLPEPLRETVELCVFQDLPYAEVAGILGIPLGTVKSRMFNALRKLKEMFDECRS